VLGIEMVREVRDGYFAICKFNDEVAEKCRVEEDWVC